LSAARIIPVCPASPEATFECDTNHDSEATDQDSISPDERPPDVSVSFDTVSAFGRRFLSVR